MKDLTPDPATLDPIEIASRDEIAAALSASMLVRRADEMQRGVDARCGARACGDRAVVDEQDVGVDSGRWKHVREFLAVGPVGSTASAVE